MNVGKSDPIVVGEIKVLNVDGHVVVTTPKANEVLLLYIVINL